MSFQSASPAAFSGVAAGPSTSTTPPPPPRIVQIPSATIEHLFSAARIVPANLTNARADLLNTDNTPENVLTSYTGLVNRILELPEVQPDAALQARIDSLTLDNQQLDSHGRHTDGTDSAFRTQGLA